MDDKLLESLASIVTDYRAGEVPSVPRPSTEHVKGWVEQFDENVRDKILTELVHVLGQTYIAKAKVGGFLSGLITNEKLTGGDAKSFWQGAKLLDIQKKGNSQREMLSMFAVSLKASLGLEIGDCGKTPACYVYIDDGLFSGNSILSDLGGWLAGAAPSEALVHVVVMALHRGGQYYARTNLKKAAQEHGKKIQFTWWRIVELEDRRTYINNSDVLRPTTIPADATTQAYVKAMKHQPVLRTPPGTGDLKIFSSDQGRELLEQQFLAKGAYIRTACPMLNQYQRPLGNMLLETLGFGSTIVTFRNCPNNAPLVFWAGNPWKPLFARKTN